MKKLPSKVAHNRPPTFFFSTGPAAQMAQKQKSRTPKSPLIQDWVFRLGVWWNIFETFLISSIKFKQIEGWCDTVLLDVGDRILTDHSNQLIESQV